MTGETISAAMIINVPAEAIVEVLADLARHAGIDGTGWVRESVDSTPLTAAGQAFGMAMYHPGHPDGTYQTANRVQKVDPPCGISWEPGHHGGSTRAVSCRGVDFAGGLRRSRELPPLTGLLISGLEPLDVSAGDELTSPSMSDCKWNR